jgi:hypothetical protein
VDGNDNSIFKPTCRGVQSHDFAWCALRADDLAVLPPAGDSARQLRASHSFPRLRVFRSTRGRLAGDVCPRLRDSVSDFKLILKPRVRAQHWSVQGRLSGASGSTRMGVATGLI